MSEANTGSGLEGWQRTHNLGELSPEHADQEVILMGWVHRRRDHGSLIFLDMRDRFGITQVVLDPAEAPEAHSRGDALRNEYVVAIKGKVHKRPEGMINKQIATGAIEVHALDVKILNKSEPLPFSINQDDKTETTETLRLKHRYLDLRRYQIRDKIVGRAKFVSAMRRAMEAQGFLDIETPYLYKSTPEGAREYLVPSRIHPGEFYALPQSPQLFKQLLMVAGFDRYYQVVKCFRDEDNRADRQPEFTQVDCEMSFAEQEQVLQTFEACILQAVKEFRGAEQPGPIQRMSYDQAMAEYGVDKPDLRFELKLNELTDTVKSTDFRVFAEAISTGGIVNALVVEGGAEKFSRKDIDALTDIVKQHGAKGLAWAKIKDGAGAAAWQSPIAKFLGDDLVDSINKETGAKEGDLLLFGAGSYDSTKASLGALRNHLGKKLELYDPAELKFVWIIDFPLLEQDSDSGRWVARHHPFTSPRPEDIELLETDPGKVKAAAYDLVLNGYEIAGGSVRIHNQELQARVFKRLGLSDEEARFKFGFLLDALSYGAPPHGGIAFGVDRIVMILHGTDAIRDVIAFPKTAKQACLMTESPSKVPLDELRELHIRTQLPDDLGGAKL